MHFYDQITYTGDMFFVIYWSQILIHNFTFIRNIGLKNTSEQYCFSLLLTNLGVAELVFQDVNSYDMKGNASCSNKLEKPQANLNRSLVYRTFQRIYQVHKEFEFPGGDYRTQLFQLITSLWDSLLEECLLIS